MILFILERGREGEREGEKQWSARDTLIDRLPLTRPNWGPGPQPRHVPRLGIKPPTLRFVGRSSIH